MKFLFATLSFLVLLTSCGGKVGNTPPVNSGASPTPPTESDRAELDRCRKMIDSSSYRSIAASFAKIRIECRLSEMEIESLADALDDSKK